MPPNPYEPPKKRRWLRFSLRSFFMAVIVVAAFFGGRASVYRNAELRVKRAENEWAASEARRGRLEQQVAKHLGYNLYTDEFAENLRERLRAMPKEKRPVDYDGKCELLKSMNVDVDRLRLLPPSEPDSYLDGERRALSPSYHLYLYDPDEIFVHSNWSEQTIYHLLKTEGE